MNADYQYLKIDRPSNGLVLVTMNRPDVLNAFNTQMAREMIDFFTRAGTEDSGVRAVVLTGAGERAFCAGADLKERNNMSEEAWSRQHVVFETMFEAVLFSPIPVLAAVNGLAYGGGGELVASCDFAYAASNATFAQREVKLAIFPGGGGTQILPRAIGPKRASELILSGEPIDAPTALAWGLVNRVIGDGSVVEAALRAAEIICANGPLAVRQAKKAMRHGMDVDIRTGLVFEREAYHRLIDSEDRHEGIAAFNARRKPVFKGR
jgi:enoyl-CoA hydratase/carnithine racemase